MRVSTEREIKLLLDDRAALPDLDGVGGLRVRPVGVHDLTATYWDTPSARLGGWSVTLRHRDGTWTLKLPHRRGGPLMSRQEIEIDAPADRLPPELLGAVRPFIRHEALAPIAAAVRSRSERRDWLVICALLCRSMSERHQNIWVPPTSGLAQRPSARLYSGGSQGVMSKEHIGWQKPATGRADSYVRTAFLCLGFAAAGPAATAAAARRMIASRMTHSKKRLASR